MPIQYKIKMGMMVLGTILSILSSSQREDWVYRYNGPGNNADGANSIVYGADGHLYAAGVSRGSGTYDDFTVISLTSGGTERWVYRYNGTGNYIDNAQSIVYGADGHLYAAGYSYDSIAGQDFVVISLTSAGAQRWVYRYAGSMNYADGAQSIVYGADGNLYAAGYSTGSGTHYDFVVISLTSAGAQRWVYRYNGPGNNADWAHSIVYGADGHLYAAGYSVRSGTLPDLIVISLTSAGAQRWVYRYNGPANTIDAAFSIVYGADSNLYAAGYSVGSGTIFDLVVISLTSAGAQRWVYRYNGPANESDWAKTIVYGADGNLYAAGVSTGSGTAYDFTVISLTSGGTERWVYRYNGTGNYIDNAQSIVYGADGHLYAAGYSAGSGTGYDFTVISLTSGGAENWVYRYNGPANDADGANSIVYGADGNLYAAGYSTGIGTYSDLTVIGLSTVGMIGEDQRMGYPSLKPRFVFAPSFFDDKIVLRFGASSKEPGLKIKLYNVVGSCIFERSLSHIPSVLTIDGLKELKSGVYFLEVSIGDKRLEKSKLIKIKAE